MAGTQLQRPLAMTPQQQQQRQQQQASALLSSSYFSAPPQSLLSHVIAGLEPTVANSAALLQSLLGPPNPYSAHQPQPLSQPLLSSQHSSLLPLASLQSVSPYLLNGASVALFPPALPLGPLLPSPASTSLALPLNQPATDSAALLRAALARSAVDSSATHSPTTASLSTPLSAYAAHSVAYPLTQPALSASASQASALAIRPLRASVWHCPMGCGQTYKKSSGRSIRRHFVFCFRQHNETAASMSDTQLSGLIAERQDTGQLQTGLRRWKMRSSRQQVDELRDEERWKCVWGCGKRYRSTSTRSIQRHIAECARRAGGGGARDRQPRAGAAARESEEEEEQEEEEEEEEHDEEAEEGKSETTARSSSGRQRPNPRRPAMSHSRSADSVASASRSTLSQVSAATALLSAPSTQLPAAGSIASSTSSDPTSGSPSAPHPVGPAPLQLLSAVAQRSDNQHAGTAKSQSSGDAQVAAAVASSQIRHETSRPKRSPAAG